jgi:hypothetical protein
VGAGAAGTCGTFEAALSWEVGAGATGTCGASGAALRWEVGAGAVRTRGTPELPCARRWALEPHGDVAPLELPQAGRRTPALWGHVVP